MHGRGRQRSFSAGSGRASRRISRDGELVLVRSQSNQFVVYLFFEKETGKKFHEKFFNNHDKVAEMIELFRSF